jgi:hypothetical protein
MRETAMVNDLLSTQHCPDRIDATTVIKRYKEKFQDLQPDPDGPMWARCGV